MIDFHTHILPAIDDGSQSMQESIQMLEEEKEQGVESVVLTPHFYATHDAVSSYLKKREDCYQKLLKETKALEDQSGEAFPRLYLGAEIYYFPGIGRAKMLSELCIRGTDVVLVELPFAQWTKEIYDDIKEIIEKQNYTVVLAHIERYFEFQKKKEIWKEMFELPLYAQMNGGSFIDRKKQKFCFKFMKKDSEILMGSDCHNMRYRLPNLFEARKSVEKKFGSEALDEIDELSEELLGLA